MNAVVEDQRDHISVRVFKKQFMGTKRNGIDIVAEEKKPWRSETFEIVRDPSNSTRVRIKVPGPDGCFLQVFVLIF